MKNLRKRWVEFTKKTFPLKVALTTTRQALSTRASGKVVWDMARALWCGQTRHGTRACGNTTRLVEEVNSFIPMATSTTEIGLTTKLTVMASTPTWRELVTKVSGKRINKMAKGLKPGPRVPSTKAIMWCQRKKDRVSIRGQMGQLMKVSGSTIKLTVMEPIYGKTDASTSDNGPTTTCRGQVFISTQTASATTVSILTIKRKVLDYITGQMAASTKVGGT